MEKIDNRKDKVLVILGVYTIGLLLGLLLYFLRFLNRVHSGWGIKIHNWERFPKKQGRMLIVSNHPSLLEAVLVPVLLSRDYLFHPSLAPWSVPDKKNFFDRWYWAWAKVRLVPIDREDNREAFKALRKIKKILDSSGRIVLFPEGGRTSGGEDFLYSEKGGKRLRVLKEGVGWLILKSSPLVIPVWIDGAEKVLPNKVGRLYHCLPKFWYCVIVKIGKPIQIKGKTKEEITQEVASNLLKLADEE